MDDGLVGQLNHQIQTINQDEVNPYKGIETKIAFDKIALKQSPGFLETISTIRITVFCI